MSKLKVDQISKATGTVDTFTLPALDGTANQHLKTDGSGQLGWATPVIATDINQPAFHVYRAAVQAIPHATYTKIALETAILDTATGFNLTASGDNPYAYTVSVAGTYLIQTGIGIDNIDDGEYVRLTVYKNGVRDNAADFVIVSGTSNESVQGGKCYLSSLAVDDRIELWIYQTEGAPQNISGTQQFLSGFKIL
jgi:hypothetical protein